MALTACRGAMPEIRFVAPGQAVPLKPALVAADAQAPADVAARVLRDGGRAADAAVALAYALTVSLPSRAGLAAQGHCVVRDTPSGVTAALRFTSSTPSLALFTRAMSALHARFGIRPWASLIAPAENQARFGVPTPPLLAADIAARAETLITDPETFALFRTARRQFITTGDLFTSRALADALAEVRLKGATGAVPDVGPQWSEPDTAARGPWTAASVSGQGEDSGGTSFVVSDRAGSVVACALSIGDVFGGGTVVPGLASMRPSPRVTIADTLAIFTGPDGTYAAITGRTAIEAARSALQSGAPLAAATERLDRANAIRCGGGSTDAMLSCEAVADPRGFGYALVLPSDSDRTDLR